MSVLCQEQHFTPGRHQQGGLRAKILTKKKLKACFYIYFFLKSYFPVAGAASWPFHWKSLSVRLREWNKPLFVPPLYLFHLFITPDSCLAWNFSEPALLSQGKPMEGNAYCLASLIFHENCFSAGFWPSLNPIVLLFIFSPHLLVQGFACRNKAKVCI